MTVDSTLPTKVQEPPTHSKSVEGRVAPEQPVGAGGGKEGAVGGASGSKGGSEMEHAVGYKEGQA